MPARILLIALSVLAVGCIEDISKDKAQAKIEETAPAAPPKIQETPEGVTTLQLNKASSRISALTAKVSAKHPIDFPSFSGALTLDGDNILSMVFSVEMAKLQSDSDRLTAHLLNEDFFDVEKYPNSSFRSTLVKAGSDEKGFTHTVTGMLEIRGQSKTISFPAEINSTAKQVEARTEFSINRQDFGVNYTGRADDLIQDNVVLTIQLVATRNTGKATPETDPAKDTPETKSEDSNTKTGDQP
jgi:polyisoprenoid-binding protein YceI